MCYLMPALPLIAAAVPTILLFLGWLYHLPVVIRRNDERIRVSFAGGCGIRAGAPSGPRMPADVYLSRLERAEDAASGDLRGTIAKLG